MKKVLIYGTSNKAIRELQGILITFNLVGFVDSNPNKSDQHLLGYQVFHYSELKNVDFDLIVICSAFSAEIIETLKSLQITNYINSSEHPLLQSVNKDLANYQSELKSKELQNIPQTPLLEQHIDCCQMLTNRIELLKKLPKHGTAVELGVATGSFSKCILEYASPSKLYLVDVWGSQRYNQGLLDNIQQLFNTQVQANEVVIKRKLSHEAVSDFPDQYFDWIYIDTTHKYKQTKLELELYAAKMKPGGIIAGHDYSMGNWAKSFRYGVIEAVHEFCVTHNWRLKYLTMDISENQSFAIEKIN
ncbi:class I SAM-dependent methyltransferase [Aliiglaciecola aliphaticivorans]